MNKKQRAYREDIKERGRTEIYEEEPEKRLSKQSFIPEASASLSVGAVRTTLLSGGWRRNFTSQVSVDVAEPARHGTMGQEPLATSLIRGANQL